MFPLCFCFCILFSFYCLSLFPHWSPRHNVHILARQDLPLLEYTVEFSQLDVLTAFNNAALNSLFWIGENYHRPINQSGECLSLIQSTARPRAQPTITPLRRVQTHWWRRAKRSDSAKNRHRARAASIVRPDARAGYSACHEGKSHRQCERWKRLGEGELIVDLGLWNVEGEFMDLYANLPPLLPPSLKPSVSPVPTSSTERAAIPTSGPGRAPYPKSNPEMAPISLSSPKRDSVPESGPERAPVPELGPERAPVPELGPERDPVPESSPKRARFPES